MNIEVNKAVKVQINQPVESQKQMMKKTLVNKLIQSVVMVYNGAMQNK